MSHEKLTHYSVDYTPWNGMPGKTCGSCAHFLAGAEPHCTLVGDPVAPTGWCMRWERKPLPALAAETVVEQSPHA